ncbi:MAG: hypothetical protein IPJ66_10735 [Bacteroidetes bacterium]|nr:hypothetical protein [Bacteroidota bacterium]
MKRFPIQITGRIAAKVIAFLAVFPALFFACKPSKPLAKVEEQVRIETPFSGSQYRSDNKFIRAVYSHESEDISQAKTRARMKSELAIAQTAGSLVKSYLKDYTAERKLEKTELNSNYQAIGELWTREHLTNCIVIGEELYKNKTTGLYTYWVAMEMNREELYTKTVSRIKADDRLRQDFDEQQFRKVYEQGINELQKEQNQ